jgi:phytoene synthase
MTDLNAVIETEVRQAEPDLWLASRLVGDPAARAALIALFAVHIELAKASVAAANPLAGEIRLAWWREELERLAEGARALGHPALNALVDMQGLDHGALQDMVEARHAELEPRPFADEAALLRHLDALDGALMRAAAGLLKPGASVALTQTARAWGWARLLRGRASWRSKGRDWTPAAWGDASDQEVSDHVRHRVVDALNEAKSEVSALPVDAFPAVAYAALAGVYARGRRPSALERRARLLWASLTGRV